MNLGMATFKMAAGLGLVLLLIYLTASLLKRLPWGKNVWGQGKNNISICSTLPLGTKKSITVIEVDGDRLLIGLTPEHITFLTRLEPSALEGLNSKIESKKPIAEIGTLVPLELEEPNFLTKVNIEGEQRSRAVQEEQG